MIALLARRSDLLNTLVKLPQSVGLESLEGLLETCKTFIEQEELGGKERQALMSSFFDGIKGVGEEGREWAVGWWIDWLAQGDQPTMSSRL